MCVCVCFFLSTSFHLLHSHSLPLLPHHTNHIALHNPRCHLLSPQLCHYQSFDLTNHKWLLWWHPQRLHLLGVMKCSKTLSTSAVWLGHIQHPLAQALPRMLHFSPRSRHCQPRDFLIIHVRIFTIINISLTYLVDLNPQFHPLMLKKEKEKKRPFKVGFINKVCNDLGVIKHSFDAKFKKIKKKIEILTK